MRGRRRFGVAAVLSVLVLAGCSALDSGYAILEREAQAEDAVPEDTADANGSADLSTSRYIGNHEGTELWLMKGEDPGAVCLLVYPASAGPYLGCGDQVTVGGPAGNFIAQRDDAPPPKDAVRISANVYYDGQL